MVYPMTRHALAGFLPVIMVLASCSQDKQPAKPESPIVLPQEQVAANDTLKKGARIDKSGDKSAGDLKKSAQLPEEIRKTPKFANQEVMIKAWKQAMEDLI